MAIPLHQQIRNKITQKVLNEEIPTVDNWDPKEDDNSRIHQSTVQRLVEAYHRVFWALYTNSNEPRVKVFLPSNSLSQDMIHMYNIVALILDCKFEYSEGTDGVYGKFINSHGILNRDYFDMLQTHGAFERLVMPVII